MARSAKEELWRALRNENNKFAPQMTAEANRLLQKILRETGQPWRELQKLAVADDDSFFSGATSSPLDKGSLAGVDVKLAAAGDGR